jgi:hypothetical protein
LENVVAHHVRLRGGAMNLKFDVEDGAFGLEAIEVRPVAE